MHTFQSALGHSTWQKGINYWLVDRFNNFTTSAHLYENIQRAVDEDHPVNPPNVAKTFGSWEWQAGFPLITVSRAGSTLTISQERFFYNRNLAQSENLWWIPLNYVVGSNSDFTSTSPDLWMENVRSVSLESSSAPKQWNESDWILFNIQQTSYYRVNYDNNLWHLLIDQLNAGSEGFERIHYRNRAQLIDDSYNLAIANLLEFDILLGIMDYLKYEEDYIPWMAANRAISFLDPRLSGSKVYEDYQDFLRTNVAAIFNRLGIELIPDEPRLDRYARTIAINVGCRVQLPECLEKSNEELRAYLNDQKRIEPEYRATIYCNGLRIGSAFEFFSMQNRMLRSSIQSERNNIISGMACTQNTDLLNAYLNLAIIPGISLTFDEKSRILTSPASHGEEWLIVMLKFADRYYMFIHEDDPILLLNMLTVISKSVVTVHSTELFMNLLANLRSQNIITQEVMLILLTNTIAFYDFHAERMAPIIEFFEQRRLGSTTSA